MALMALAGFFAYRRATRSERIAGREAKRLAAQLRENAVLTHCRRCGYDLRGGHDRCPECGAVLHPLDARRLENEWPEVWTEPRALQKTEVAAVVHVAYNFAEARNLVHQLRARGVWACVGSESELSGVESSDELAITVSTLDRELALGIVDDFRVARPRDT